jgi:hypothetical protein
VALLSSSQQFSISPSIRLASRRPLVRFSCEMAPKRKKGEPLVAEPPAAKIRRSSRKTNGVINQQHDEIHQRDEPKRPFGVAGGTTLSPEAFQRTMKELGEMGLKLQSAVKRQRLAVETSDLSKCDPERVREEATKTRPALKRKAKESPEEATEQKVVEKPKVVEQTETADVSEANADVETAERSARRPPPVNSDVLPLPWKGRLGYVSTDVAMSKPITATFIECCNLIIRMEANASTHRLV